MKKLNTVLMIALGLFFVTASVSAAGEAVEVGVAWVGKSGMPKRIIKGFDQTIRKLAPNIKIEYQKELASSDELAKVVDRWEKPKKAWSFSDLTEPNGLPKTRLQYLRLSGVVIILCSSGC